MTSNRAAALRERGRTRRRPKRRAPIAEPYRLAWWRWPGQPSIGDVCDALAFQYFLLGELLQPVRAADWQAPTRLAGWRVADLLGHVITNAEHVVRMAHTPASGTGAPVQDALDWYQGSDLFSSLIADEARAVAGAVPPTRLAELARRHQTAASTAAAVLRSGEPGRILGGAATDITLADYAVTRLVEAVVHGLDLADALGRPGLSHAPAVYLVSGYFASLGERRAPAIPPSARIALGVDGELVALRAERPVAVIPAVGWIEAATGRRPLRAPLPESHRWLAELLPLVT